MGASAATAANQPAKDNSKKAVPAKSSEPFIIKTMPSYLAIRKSLGDNNLKDVSTNAAAFAKSISAGIAVEKQKKQSEELAPLNNILKATQPLIGKQSDIKITRAAFGKLGDALVDYLNKYVGLYYTKDFKIYYCNMSKHYWVQKAGDKMVNPYYQGKDMVNCGEEVQNTDPDMSDSVPGRDAVMKCEPPRRH